MIIIHAQRISCRSLLCPVLCNNHPLDWIKCPPCQECSKMGKLLSLLARDDSTCCSPKSYDVFLDFENAAPTETEREVYDEVDRVLKESEAVLEEIQVYKVMQLKATTSQVDYC